jgi:Rrf2 family protein
MKLLNKNTDYAVRALIVLALNKEKFVSAREISKVQNVPYQFLRAIMQDLIKHSYIEAKEGIKGGFKLIKPSKNIKLTDIINVFQGEIELSDCLFRKKICQNRNTCVLRKEIKKIESKVIKEFENITLESLVKKIKKS